MRNLTDRDVIRLLYILDRLVEEDSEEHEVIDEIRNKLYDDISSAYNPPRKMSDIFMIKDGT